MTQIHTTSVYVENQQEALKFWTEKVGFEVKANYPMTPEASWIELTPKHAQSAIVIYPKALMPNWKELKPSIVFLCDNIDETVNELKSRGVKFIRAKKNGMGNFCDIFRHRWKRV
jgi:lactoylglutathione lyase